MRKSTKLLILALSLLLMAALVPTLASAATNITRVEITDMPIPYYCADASYMRNLQCRISAGSTNLGAYSEEHTYAESGWFPEGSDYKKPSENRINTGEQILGDVYYHAAIHAPAGYEFPASFTASQIVCTQLKCKPYRIEITGRTVDGITIALHFHPIYPYFGNIIDYTPIGIYGDAFPTEVIDGQVPNKTDYTINACGNNHFTLSNIDWTEKGSKLSTSKFVAGKNYEVKAVLTPDDRYASFETDDINKIINSKSITVAGETVGDSDRVKVEWKTPGKSLLITYYPKTAVKNISEVSLGGVQQAQTGGTPQKSGFTTTTEGVSVALYKWMDANNKEFTGTFEAEKTYSLWLKVTHKDGYTFPANVSSGVKVDTSKCAGTKGSIYGGKPDGDGSSEPGVMYVQIIFKTGAAPSAAPSAETPTHDVSGGKVDLNTNGTATYTGPTGNADTVIIPDTVTVDGVNYQITKIADYAFYNNKNLKSIVIGANIREIGKSAFESCTKLKTVKGGANVKTIGSKAFYGDKKLSSFPTMSNLETIGSSAFKKCAALKKFTIGSKVNSIGKYAFQDCKKLKTITIKSTLLTSSNVKSKAFKGIAENATIKCPKKQLKSYKKWLTKRGVPESATIKKK